MRAIQTFKLEAELEDWNLLTLANTFHSFQKIKHASVPCGRQLCFYADILIVLPTKRPTVRIWATICSYFEKSCRKKRTRQTRKVLWVVLSSLFFKEIWKNGKGGHGHMSVSAKGKQQKLVRQLQCQEQCIEHIPYYLSGLSRAHFSDNLSRNSCIWPQPNGL